MQDAQNQYKYSPDPVIEAGYYHGIGKAVQKETGLSMPTIYAAIRTGKADTEQRFQALKAARKLIAERQKMLKNAGK